MTASADGFERNWKVPMAAKEVPNPTIVAFLLIYPITTGLLMTCTCVCRKGNLWLSNPPEYSCREGFIGISTYPWPGLRKQRADLAPVKCLHLHRGHCSLCSPDCDRRAYTTVSGSVRCTQNQLDTHWPVHFSPCHSCLGAHIGRYLHSLQNCRMAPIS